jgi:hypothetical protein
MARYPRFQDEFLESICIAFQKRRKSLSHRASYADIAKVYERRGPDAEEHVEIDLVKYDRALLRLWAWPDRFIWLDARRPTKKGWDWSWTRDGRLVGSSSAPDVIAALEATYDTLYEMNADRADELNEPWVRVLARGPVAARFQ